MADGLSLAEFLALAPPTNGPMTASPVHVDDKILDGETEAHRTIVSLLDRSKTDSRPTYREASKTMEQLAELNNKPDGTIDLEMELKRNEDWMRRGNKLFGKENLPFYTLRSHLEYVLRRNENCFDISADTLEVYKSSSRKPNHSNSYGAGSRDVFCICRCREFGLMTKCEACHEW